MGGRTTTATLCCLASLVLPGVLTGCGTTRKYTATEQMVVSDAVDASIAKIDFRPLSGQTVFLDSRFIRYEKNGGFVNSDYVTSALRQQIVAAGCRLQDRAEDADVVIEARVGALGMDDHRITFGIPENNALSATVNLIPGTPQVPPIPEISLAKREAREGAAKVVAFAYDRATRQPLWQSGVGSSTATAKDTWVAGVGPFQSGSVRENLKLAGNRLIEGRRQRTAGAIAATDRPPVQYGAEVVFENGRPVDRVGRPPEPMIDSAPLLDAGTRIAEQPDGDAAEVKR